MARSVTELYGSPPPGIDLQANQEVLDDSVVAVLATIATLAVAFRIIVKKRKRVGLDGDDWFILMALLEEYGTAACTLTSNYFGAGKHVWATNTSSLRKMSIALFIYPWIYVVATVGLKLSFCWTYMRIFSLSSIPGTIRCRTWIDRSLVACALASCIYALSVWLPMTVVCRPLRHFWDQYTGASNGRCMDYLSMWIFTGICSAALDLIILLLPIPWIWSLQMSWTKKLSVMGILALGTLVMIAAIIRLVYMSRMMHETDITWALGPAQIWTSLEPSLGIVSSCLITTFRPIMSGIRSMFGLKDSDKANRLPSYTEQRHGRGASHKVPRFGGPHEEGYDEEELEELGLCDMGGEHIASVTTEAPQQGDQKVLPQGRRNFSRKGPLDRRIRVETSVIVEQAPGDEMSVTHSRPTNYTTRW